MQVSLDSGTPFFTSITFAIYPLVKQTQTRYLLATKIPFKYNIEQNRPFSQALSQLASVKRIRVIIDAELRIMNNINALSHA